MKKGESIRLEIRNVSPTGLLLYSYKKKAEIFVETSQLKAGFSKEKYQGLIGSPIIMRLTMTRPEIRVSQKFIHEDAPIFDDYVLKPKTKEAKEDPSPRETLPKNMIKNKEIIITKENQFDKGWTLFHPYEPIVPDNRSYRDAMLTDVVRLITHADEVDLILCEPCLSSRIVSEIEWANKYIKLRVIVKSETILQRYRFDVSSMDVDPNINFNYIGIQGKETGFYIIRDGYIQIDDSVDRVYFRNGVCRRDYSFLGSVKTVMVVDPKGEQDYTELIEETRKAGIECFYAVNAASYNRKHFDFAKKQSIPLLISNQTIEGVLLVNKNDTLSCLTVGPKDFFVTYPIAKVSALLGSMFRCGFYADTVDVKAFQGDVYTCHDGQLTRLNIQEKKVVSIDVPIHEMADFVTESFDFSITDEHNRHAAEAKKVEYRFTLIPPLYDESFSESTIYEPLHALLKKWKALQCLDIEKIKSDYHSFLDQDFGIIDFLDSSVSFTNHLTKAVKDCSYTGYYTWTKAAADLFQYYDETLLEVCGKIFGSINKESAGTKFSKFDAEIAGYEQTIKEKTALIEQGIDVLSNKRRVDILTQKIAGLQELKKRFENTSDSRNDKTSAAFIDHCSKLLSNHLHTGVNDSIGTIVKPKEETKMAKLESFVDTHLFAIKQYIVDCQKVLNQLLAVHIPENYPVYDKNGEKFIVINALKEYEQTKSLCNEFGLKCVTRR